MRPKKDIIMWAKFAGPLRFNEILSLDTYHLAVDLYPLSHTDDLSSKKIIDIFQILDSSVDELNSMIISDLKSLKSNILDRLWIENKEQSLSELLKNNKKSQYDFDKWSRVIGITPWIVWRDNLLKSELG